MILLVIYTCSGLVALAYEVLWVRMLALQFGVSIFGAVITVAAFMAGLGSGSLLGVRLARYSAKPLRVFAILESGVALYALLLPLVMASVDTILSGMAVATELRGWYALQCGAALVLLFLPALAMGAGFPLILKAGRGTVASIGRVYGLNTLGGALGALLPLLLLPLVGWSQALLVVAATGFAVAAAALVLSFFTPLPARAVHGEATARQGSVNRPGMVSLLAYAGIGAAALIMEIAWTRLFGMIMLRTEYVLAVILAVFLLGIAMGSLLVRRGLADTWLNIFPLLAGVFSVVSLWVLPYLSRWVEAAEFSSLSGALLWQGGAVAAVTLPVTLVLGAWLPLLSHRTADPVHGGAWFYGVNSAGAATGALLAGFVLIPWLGTPATLCVAALLLFGCALVWATTRWMWLGIAGLMALAWPVQQLPQVSTLLPQAHAGSRDLYVHEDAISITHVIEQPDGQRLLLSDLQRMDASTEPTAVALQKDQSRLPLLLHPAPGSVLYLGLGTGISAAGSVPFSGLERVAVELSRGAIVAASQWFTAVNQRISESTDIIRDDARHFLQAGERRFDVIIGDVFHPDLAGRSALLSVQQFRRARARLAPGGLFVQWLALNQFDRRTLAVVLRSFQQVFPHAVGFIDGFRFALVGPRGDIAAAPAILARLQQMDGQEQQRATGGEGRWTWLGRYWGRLDLGPGAVQDEWRPYIEFHLPQSRYRNDLNTASVLAYLLEQRPSVEQAARAWQIPDEHTPAFERGFIATELGMRSWLASLEGDERRAQRLLRLAYEANPRDRWVGFGLADRMMATLDQAEASGMSRRRALESIVQIRPDHTEALRALARLEKQAGNQQQARKYLDRIREISPLSHITDTTARIDGADMTATE